MRPIDADVLEKYLNARVAKLRKEYGNYDAYTDGFDDAVAAVELSPTLTLDDLRPEGEWVEVDGFTCCNHCGCSPADWEADSKNEKGLPPYCHSCGRKMKGCGE